MKEYFSDKEKGKKEFKIEEISIDVWNGIVSVFEEYKTGNYFSYSFPKKCNDNESLIVGFDEELFNDRVKAEIPTISVPVQRKAEINKEDFWKLEVNDEIDDNIDKYSVLDFVEFLYKNFKTPIQKDYHDFFKHYHLEFEDNKQNKENFINDINQLFERNGIVFYLENNGEIKRKLPKEFINIIRDYKTNDAKTNELIALAIEKIKSVKFEERRISLEKIWDAFERIKTYYKEKNKKHSIEKLLDLVSEEDANIKEVLTKEAKELTNIGNEFQIRHFETNKKEIKNIELIDYLFYRMMCFINILAVKLEN